LLQIRLIFLILDRHNDIHHLPNKPITYTGLLNDIYYSSKEIDTREVIKLVRQAGTIPQQLLPFKGIIHVIDYTKRKHVGISGPLSEMMGYDPRDVIDNGLDFVMDIFQKDDFKIFNESIFTKVISTLQDFGQSAHEDLLFSFNYRMRNPEGKWRHLYQQVCYVTDPVTKLPLYNIGVVTDISPIKRNSCIAFTIDKKNNGQPFLQSKNIVTEYFYPDPELSQLSKREREVLGWLAEGYSSKQIADKLYLSESTVTIHRKNMLKKTNTKNIAELIRYGVEHGLI
jgi:DNA-binding CsgD family transcriptional regulator